MKSAFAFASLPGVLSALLLGHTTAIHAAQLASESFNYVSGSLNGKVGGTGFTGAWAGVADDITRPLTVDSTVLSYPGVPSSGGSVKLPNNTLYTDSQRTFATPFGNGVYYFSFLAQTVSDSGMYYGIALGGNLANDENSYAVYMLYNAPHQSSAFRIKREFGGGESPDFELFGVGIFFVTGRLTVAPGNDTMEVWINPPFGIQPPGIADISLTGYDLGVLSHLMILGGGVSSPNSNPRIGEFRLGTTFNDVVPAPEPGVLPLGLAGLALLFGRRRQAPIARR